MSQHIAEVQGELPSMFLLSRNTCKCSKCVGLSSQMLFFSSFWIKNSYDLVKQILCESIFHDETGENNMHLVFLWLMQKSNHSLHPKAHTGFKQLEPVCQVKRLNVPLEKKLTAKTDWGEMKFCILSSKQPLFSFNLVLPFKQKENLNLFLEQISLPRLKFWDAVWLQRWATFIVTLKSVKSTALEWKRMKNEVVFYFLSHTFLLWDLMPFSLFSTTWLD